jgi:hypothetical protein
MLSAVEDGVTDNDEAIYDSDSDSNFDPEGQGAGGGGSNGGGGDEEELPPTSNGGGGAEEELPPTSNGGGGGEEELPPTSNGGGGDEEEVSPTKRKTIENYMEMTQYVGEAVSNLHDLLWTGQGPDEEGAVEVEFGRSEEVELTRSEELRREAAKFLTLSKRMKLVKAGTN